MSRPKSMPDFTALMDASTPIFEKRIHTRRQTSPERKAGHARKNPSISLAAGLIMNMDSPKGTAPPSSPQRQSRERTIEEGKEEQEEGGNLFYAYALKSDYANSPPYILTFASAAICSRWWSLVQREYPDSARPSPQLFVLKGEDLQQIQDDPKFFGLRNRWFYTSQDRPTSQPTILPLQTENGQAIAPPQPSQPPIEEKPATSAIDSLAEKLDRLVSVVASNAEQVHALSVAQSAGLQRMQEINESNSTQIKAIADSQMKLQALVDQNASHYIALSNTSFQSHEKTRDTLKTTASHIQSFSKTQSSLAQTCDAMMRSIEGLAASVSQMSQNLTMSDSASTQSTLSAASFGAMANRISPPPRKLNRRIKGVWYEYDDSVTPNGSPRRRVDSMDTPPKSPIVFKNV